VITINTVGQCLYRLEIYVKYTNKIVVVDMQPEGPSGQVLTVLLWELELCNIYISPKSYISMLQDDKITKHIKWVPFKNDREKYIHFKK
jgi:hypothetical protein